MAELITSEKESRTLDISRIEKLIAKFYKLKTDKETFFNKIYFCYNEIYSPVMNFDDYNSALKSLGRKLNKPELMKYRI